MGRRAQIDDSATGNVFIHNTPAAQICMGRKYATSGRHAE